ncbi:MAG: class I SAM-dependent methyltransferase [Chloroflexota bacterium]
MSPERDRDLARVRDTWESLGAEDPLWAVLTDPAKRGRGWDQAEFLATGETEIARAMGLVDALDIALARGHAVDFGCGAGRLARALASRFDHVTGIDIASTMIDEARRLNADVPNADWVVNVRPDLAILETASVDFLYSRLVLQHMAPRLALGYLAEFARILRPGGVAMFQYPSRWGHGAAGPRSTARWLRSLVRRPSTGRMEMHGTPMPEVVGRIRRSGLVVAAVIDDAGSAPPWEAFLYVVTRPPAPESPRTTAA